MIKFDFATATEIVFGSGRARELGARAKALGTRALVVTGAHPERFQSLLAAVSSAGVTLETFCVSQEPTTQTARDGVTQALAVRAELVIGLGGGSVLDAAKAIAALATNGGEPLDFLEVVGRGLPLRERSLPALLLPTTSGTGSEVTRNAVLQVESERVKVSLRSPWMLPTLALVDPELTLSVPPAVTRATGLDALTQVLEPFVSNARGP
ncbi:MAG TPA: iron-containing alcohol dehydrogenase, partial [Polyangiaceae bacterium]|nr:iron-containing alcohol dehydrogenase [Polyangiaceae bacterium]